MPERAKKPAKPTKPTKPTKKAAPASKAGKPKASKGVETKPRKLATEAATPTPTPTPTPARNASATPAIAEIERKIAAHEREASRRARPADLSDNTDSVRVLGLLAARLVLEAEGPPEDVRAWLDRAVSGALRDLERARYRVIGPRWQLEDYELLGAACLVGRGPELVRAMAHFHSLGEGRATPVLRAFLGRQGLSRTAAEGGKSAGDDADALVSAGAQGLARAIEKFLSGTWAAHARGLMGARASFLATGLCAFWNVRPALPNALERYVASSLFEPPKLAPAPMPRPTLPRAPDEQDIRGPVRDTSRPAADQVAIMKSIASWVYESLALAKNERAGEYLVSVPEACVDVATAAYAAGAECKDVGAWLAFAVDLQVARLATRVPGDRLTWFDDCRELAAAAILTDRSDALAEAWRGAADLGIDAAAAASIAALCAWLDGGKLASDALVKHALPSAARAPWPGPFSAFVTAASKRGAEVPAKMKVAVMTELL